jgi:Methyltransferase domain
VAAVKVAAARELARALITTMWEDPRQVRLVPMWWRQRQGSLVDLRTPWWPYLMVDEVARRLPPEATIFEYGCGASTLWFEDHGATVTGVEHHAGWYRDISALTGPSTEVLLVEPETEGSITTSLADGYFDRYVATVSAVPDGSMDLIIIDGRCRVACATAAKPKVKPGGSLLLDDSDRARYAPVFALFAGWQTLTIQGLKVGGGASSTLFTRPPDPA